MIFSGASTLSIVPQAPAYADTAADSTQNAAIEELKREMGELKNAEKADEETQTRSIAWRFGIAFLALLAASALFIALKIGIKKFEEIVSEKDVIRESAQTLRLKTISKIFKWVGSIFIGLIWAYVVLDKFGVNVAPLLAGAGIIGVALGFGGQYLIRDLINGVFILVEGQFGVNNIVKIGDYAGVVEDVNLRTTTLRDMEGRVIVIPNGEIKVVINMARDFSQAVLNIGVAYKENVDKVMDVISQIGKEIRADFLAGLRDDIPYFIYILFVSDADIQDCLREIPCHVDHDLDLAIGDDDDAALHVPKSRCAKIDILNNSRIIPNFHNVIHSKLTFDEDKNTIDEISNKVLPSKT